MVLSLSVAVAEYDLLSDDDREEIDEDDDGEEEQAERNVEVKDEREENKQDEGTIQSTTIIEHVNALSIVDFLFSVFSLFRRR